MATADALTNMSISLPAAQKEYLKGRVAKTGCATTSEYVRRLIHADQVAQEKADLERRLLARIDEPSTPFTAEDWSEIRSEVRRKLATKRKGR
ncbi:MAG TPA: hypothetical protein VMT52_08060 [Planctomycetota bacterium]|nr:hypothetical protein [Planctomycetota bacterium]